MVSKLLVLDLIEMILGNEAKETSKDTPLPFLAGDLKEKDFVFS